MSSCTVRSTTCALRASRTRRHCSPCAPGIPRRVFFAWSLGMARGVALFPLPEVPPAGGCFGEETPRPKGTFSTPKRASGRMSLPSGDPGIFQSGRGVFLRCGSLPNRPKGVFAGGECVSSNRCGPLVCRVCAVCEPVGRKAVRANLVFAPLSAQGIGRNRSIGRNRGIGRSQGSPVRANLVFAPFAARKAQKEEIFNFQRSSDPLRIPWVD